MGDLSIVTYQLSLSGFLQMGEIQTKILIKM